jgi:hypothetical protein
MDLEPELLLGGDPRIPAVSKGLEIAPTPNGGTAPRATVPEQDADASVRPKPDLLPLLVIILRHMHRQWMAASGLRK